jgi:DNA mismatch repair protein MutH
VIREFAERGIETKTVPLSPAGMPYESMSFRGFRYRPLLEERWEDSDLLSCLNRLLIVPIIRDTRITPVGKQVFGRAFFWSPSDIELRGIRLEWATFRREILHGRAKELTPESQTRYIHVRPKARDGNDTDFAPIVGPVVKKCFWLNRDYVRRVVNQNQGLALTRAEP